MAVPSSPCAPAAHRSRSAPATALGSARRQRRYRHLTGLRAGRRPALLSEADLLPVPSGVPEGGDDGELVAVPLGGRAELDVECLEKEPPGSGEACDACRIILLNTSLLLYVLVVENETNGACGPQDRQARSAHGGHRCLIAWPITARRRHRCDHACRGRARAGRAGGNPRRPAGHAWARTGWPGSGTSGSSRSRLWPARRW